MRAHRNVRESDGKCPWEGRRLAEITAGKAVEWCQDYENATSERLQHMLATLPHGVVAMLMVLIQALKTAMVDLIQSKFEWTKHIPYRIVSIWLCTIGLLPRPMATQGGPY